MQKVFKRYNRYNNIARKILFKTPNEVVEGISKHAACINRFTH